VTEKKWRAVVPSREAAPARNSKEGRDETERKERITEAGSGRAAERKKLAERRDGGDGSDRAPRRKGTEKDRKGARKANRTAEWAKLRKREPNQLEKTKEGEPP
jgi:hypothetical protein